MDEQHRAEHLDRFIDALRSREPLEIGAEEDAELADLYAIVRELRRRRPEAIEWPEQDFSERLTRELAAALKPVPEPVKPLAADELPRASANGHLPPRGLIARVSSPPRRRWPRESLRLAAAGLALIVVTATMVALLGDRRQSGAPLAASTGTSQPQLGGAPIPPAVFEKLAVQLSTPVVSVATPPRSLGDLAPAVAAALQLGYGQTLDLQLSVPGATVRLKWAYADTRFVVLYYQIEAQAGSPEPVPSLALWPPMLEDQAGRVLALRGGSTTAIVDHTDDGVLWFDASRVAKAGEKLDLRLTASALRVADPGAPATPGTGSRLIVPTTGGSGTPSTPVPLSFDLTVDVQPAADLPLVQGSPVPTTGPGPAGTPAESPAPACDSSQLEAAVLPGGVAAGHVRDDIELRNSSSRPCSLTGYLGVTLMNAQKQALGVQVQQVSGQTYFGPVPPVNSIELPPDTRVLGSGDHQGHAFFTLVSNDVCPNPATAAKNVAWLALAPPGASSPLTILAVLGTVCDPGVEPVISEPPAGIAVSAATPPSPLTVPLSQADKVWQAIVDDTQGSIDPILKPAQLASGFETVQLLRAGPGTFGVQYGGAGKQLLIAVYGFNIPECGAGCAIRQVTVRGQRAILQVNDDTIDPPNHVWLWWTEPGADTRTGLTDPGSVPYLISVDGLTADQVLQIADSLVPVNSASVTTATAAPCKTSQLQLAVGGPVSEATGQHTLPLTLTNQSKQACYLEGYPTVTLRNGAGQSLPFDYQQHGDQMVTSQPPPRVDLAPGGHAYVTLNKYRCDLAQTSGTDNVARVVALTLPDSATPLTLTLTADSRTLSYCQPDSPGDPGLQVAVSPFEPTLEATLAH